VGKIAEHHMTDEELLEKFYEQYDNYWLGILLPRYTLLLLGVCMKYLKNSELAKDMVQQVFLKTLTELSKYRVEYIKSWLYQVAKNDCLMQLRKKNIYFSELPETISYAEEDGYSFLEKEQSYLLLESAIDTLNREQKTCITLFYLQKKSYIEITNSTGYSLLSVKSYIQNGKRNLKISLDKKMNRGYE
jgi:RNA polymerase sigma-70 factor (ECF subfamily)